MIKLPNHTALKEWANVVDAMGSGEQVILIRKGGIADPKFGVEAERFYLYPTFFHQGEQEPRSSVEIHYWCEVVRTWSIRELEALERLESDVVLPKESLLARYRFRPDQALHVIGVRAWRLPEPRTVSFRAEYGGCVSWISVDDEIDIAGSIQVVPEGDLTARLDELEQRLNRDQEPAGSR